MPLYEYRCQECGHRFEVLQRIGENGADLDCPSCRRRGVERQLSTFASAGTGSGGGCAPSSGFV